MGIIDSPPETIKEEVTLIRKRLGWIIFWLIAIAVGVGNMAKP